MLISAILEEYLKKHPIYKELSFKLTGNNSPEKLPNILILTQYIIDKLIADQSKRVAIILPDDNCNIIPLILSKYFSNLAYDIDYAGNVLDDIQIGQHLRLGKAVVEFEGLDESKTHIKFRVDKSNPLHITCPINGIHYMFEKTDGALSSSKTWFAAKKLAEEQLCKADGIINALKAKRTALNKTISILSAKNSFKEYVEQLNINGCNFQDVVSYGEIDLEDPTKFNLFNRGRLDCLPSIAVSARLDEIYYLLKDQTIRDKLFAIFSTSDKFDEIVSNPDAFRRILTLNIPFVVFIPESSFEYCPYITGLGFELWHWKPSTMKSEALLEDNIVNQSKTNGNMFANFSERVNHAALADFILSSAKDSNLLKLVHLIKLLSQQAIDGDINLAQLVRMTWQLQKKLNSIICPINDRIKGILTQDLEAIQNKWSSQYNYYEGLNIAKTVAQIIENFEQFINKEAPYKWLKLKDLIQSFANKKLSCKIIIPDKYQFYADTYSDLEKIAGNCSFKLQPISDFYNQQSELFEAVDYLIVPWFDKDEYIHIKQTYCYENLAFILYNYENKWRESYLQRFDECLPHELVKSTAKTICFDQSEISDKPFDKVFAEETEEFVEIADYNIGNVIVRSTFGNTTSTKDLADVIDCIPVLLSEEKIAYFYPNHEIIDVTSLAKGDCDFPVKKEALKLKKGNKILIRQSGKDIIKEKADELMKKNNEEGLRSLTEIWPTLLSLYATDKSIIDVCKAINDAGAECSFQQVRYWLSGETIMPRDKSVLIAIGIVASSSNELHDICNDYLKKVDNIFDAGKRVQIYHQQAGRWLTSELKNKAKDIKTIANSSTFEGIISGIGAVHVYSVEDILDKELVERTRIKRIEDLY